MSNPNTQKLPSLQRRTSSFADILTQFEKSHTTKRVEGSREATVISVSPDSVVLDIGFKTEGVLPLAELGKDSSTVKPGDKLQVTIKGRDPEGYYQLTRGKVVRPPIGLRWKKLLRISRSSLALLPEL